MKELQPNKQQRDNSLCDTCVYCPVNLDRSQYAGKGIGELPDNGCTLDFVPGDGRCDEMRTSNCSIRKAR
jgi:hypothetical protein